jgi:pyridoxal phosphate enzyme (YggS family)
MFLTQATLNKAELNKIIQNISLKSPQPKKVTIIAVTKTFTYSAIQEAFDNNIYNIGENKIQELENKIKNKTLPEKLKIHFIGKLQSNKAKKAVLLCDYIQTVDSIRLAQKINNHAKALSKKQKIYIQINIGNDNKKQGLIGENGGIYRKISLLENVKVVGLMTILPKVDKKETKNLYIAMKKLQQKIKKNHFKECEEISMGMSGDYNVALESGATNIRIGTKLYGKRK